MSSGSSKLNPNAAEYVPLAKRVEDVSKLAPVYFDGSEGFAVSSSNDEGNQGDDGMVEEELTYLQTMFPTLSEESVMDFYIVSECDVDAAYDMMSQLEHTDSKPSQSLPDSSDIGHASEPQILPESATGSVSVDSPKYTQPQN